MQGKKWVLLFPLVAVLMSACGNLSTETEDILLTDQGESVVFTTDECRKMDISASVTVDLRFQAARKEDLYFSLSGLNYGRMYFMVGDQVKKGDVICELETEDLDREIENIMTELSNLQFTYAQQEEKRAQDIRTYLVTHEGEEQEKINQAISKIRLSYDGMKVSTQDRIDVLNMRKEELEVKISERKLYAPFDGVISYIYQPEEKEKSSINRKMVALSDVSSSVFVGKTPQASSFKEGEAYVVETSRGNFDCLLVSPDALFIPEEEQNEQDIYLLPSDLSYSLEDKDRGSVTLVLEEHADTLLVPVEATSVINGQEVCYVPDENGLKTYVPVTFGLRDDTYVEILSGLSEGDLVITN